MKIINLTENSKKRTSNVFFVRGDLDNPDDVNTLVDVGSDLSIMLKLEKMLTASGRGKIERVVLTHIHPDNTGILFEILRIYSPEVCAFSDSLKCVDRLLRDGDRVKMGNRMFEVIHIPEHSDDSICLYCDSERVLFAGDTPITIRFGAGSCQEKYVRFLEEFSRKNVEFIHFGHGASIMGGGYRLIRSSLEHVRIATAIRKIC